MTHGRIATLYDNLHAFESRYRRGPAYPVHKRLRFPDPGMTDIYDWIIATIGLPETGTILDAGCGTGFGTLRLAEASRCEVTGISISGQEIAAAGQALRQSPSDGRVTFLQQDFDELPAASFDLIIAVESLKHSLLLARTLAGFRTALRAGGRIVIVEDLYSGSPHDARAVRLAMSWHLAQLYREADYRLLLGAERCQIIELTNYMPPASPTRVLGRRIMLASLLLLGWFLPRETRAALLGGLSLQELYDAGLMSYRALIT